MKSVTCGAIVSLAMIAAMLVGSASCERSGA